MTDDSLKANYRGVFDGRLGFGSRPAVLVIDFIKRLLGRQVLVR